MTIAKRKTLHKKLWKKQSERIRKEEGGVCFTCDKVEWDEQLGEPSIKGMQAGHFRHNVLDFDPLNIHSQCVRCNHHLSGNGVEYSRRLIAKFGLDAVNELHRRADMALRGELHSEEWYLEKIKKEEEKLKNL